MKKFFGLALALGAVALAVSVISRKNAENDFVDGTLADDKEVKPEPEAKEVPVEEAVEEKPEEEIVAEVENSDAESVAVEEEILKPVSDETTE